MRCTFMGRSAVLAIACCASAARADNTVMLVPRLDPLSKLVTDPPTPSAHAYGVGVHYLFGFPPTRDGRMPGWPGVGVDVRVLTEEWTDFGALAINAVAKMTGGHAPPSTFELHAGAIIGGEDSGAFVGGALLISMFYFEIGYSYQRELGIDEQPWLGRHQLTLRGLIPVFVH